MNDRGGVSSISYIPGTVEVVCGTTHALMYLVNLDTLEVQFLRENHMGAVTQVPALSTSHQGRCATRSVHGGRAKQSNGSRIIIHCMGCEA